MLPAGMEESFWDVCWALPSVKDIGSPQKIFTFLGIRLPFPQNNTETDGTLE